VDRTVVLREVEQSAQHAQGEGVEAAFDVHATSITNA
jgi:hypothetical protein